MSVYLNLTAEHLFVDLVLDLAVLAGKVGVLLSQLGYHGLFLLQLLVAVLDELLGDHLSRLFVLGADHHVPLEVEGFSLDPRDDFFRSFDDSLRRPRQCAHLQLVQHLPGFLLALLDLALQVVELILDDHVLVLGSQLETLFPASPLFAYPWLRALPLPSA